jgi:small subunit ribosomal protein S27e
MIQSNLKLKETKSKFVKVRCPKCKNEQIIFGKSASNIKCLVCENEIAEATGGKTKIKARILEVLG